MGKEKLVGGQRAQQGAQVIDSSRIEVLPEVSMAAQNRKERRERLLAGRNGEVLAGSSQHLGHTPGSGCRTHQVLIGYVAHLLKALDYFASLPGGRAQNRNRALCESLDIGSRPVSYPQC